jgi:uncharacterized protein (DUF1800 family)
MQRRSLIVSAGWAAIQGGLLAGCASPAVRPSAPPHPGVQGDAADLAWLNRVTWGVDSASLAQFRRVSRRDYIGAQLHPSASPDLAATVQAQIDALAPSERPLEASVAEMEQRRRDADAIADDAAKKSAQQAYQQDMNRMARDAASGMLLRALYSPHQVQEQLTWFWFNHFNVHQYKSNLRVLVGDYEHRLRAGALGHFSDLVIASATHAAMIRYLDNEQNAANHINENYAREVMELHTLGVDAGYSQRDVQELARVLTGLGVNFSDKAPTLKPALQALYVRRGLTEFNPARHDMGDKWVLGEKVSARGWNEIIEQLTRLARHPATARHVCRKLAVYFAADQPAAALLDRMVRAFDASAGDIAVTLQALFDAPEFTPTLSRKFKDPMHYVVSSLRLAYDGKYIANAAPAVGWLNRLNEGLYNRQTPDGYPMDEAAWSSSGQMSTRFEVAKAIGSGSAGLFRVEGPAPSERPAFPQLSNALYHDALAQTLSAATRAALEATGSPQEWNVVLLSSPEFMFR